ncbi:MAG: VOC family protein [Anaerolineales bacterium]|jgi:uncharacterized glyoxalase superfamily protein PhnB
MIKTLTPNLMVEDVNQTITFYEDVFGFELSQTVPEEGKFAWASMRSRDVEIMLQDRESLSEELPVFEGTPIGGSLTFYLRMDGLEAFYDRIKDQVTVLKELHTTFYGMKEVAVKDPNGYIFVFAEAD